MQSSLHWVHVSSRQVHTRVVVYPRERHAVVNSMRAQILSTLLRRNSSGNSSNMPANAAFCISNILAQLFIAGVGTWLPPAAVEWRLFSNLGCLEGGFYVRVLVNGRLNTCTGNLRVRCKPLCAPPQVPAGGCDGVLNPSLSRGRERDVGGFCEGRGAGAGPCGRGVAVLLVAVQAWGPIPQSICAVWTGTWTVTVSVSVSPGPHSAESAPPCRLPGERWKLLSGVSDRAIGPYSVFGVHLPPSFWHLRAVATGEPLAALGCHAAPAE
eukprot:361363-Chlamydomonas_euryale.AAC.5